jgi:SAM-dependent methyltransferase
VAIAPDGSPVELYLRLPGDDEAELVAGVVAPPARLLELGCGAGRVTRPLVARGYDVTAVDNSAEMLAHVAGARAVLADVTTLRLGDEFDVVLLASHFVNTPDADERRSILDVCARHVAPDGVVVVERYAPGWVATVEPSRRERNGVVFDLHDLTRDGDVLHATITYEFAGNTIAQSFRAVDVGDERLAADAAAVGLVIDRVLAGPSWVVLRRDA